MNDTEFVECLTDALGNGVITSGQFHQYLHQRTQQQENTTTHEVESETPVSIEVGKIILSPAQSNSYDSTPESSVSVHLDTEGVRLMSWPQNASSARDSLYGGNGNVAPTFTPEQTVELGQLLLKAAEVQPKYAEAQAKLAQEKALLEKRFKDVVGGLGSNLKDEDTVVTVGDEHTTFSTSRVIDA